MRYDNFDLWSQEDFIEAFRYMFCWIAEETRKRKTVITPSDFFEAHNIKDRPEVDSYLCEYIHRYENCNCNLCPVIWSNKNRTDGCMRISSPYYKWSSLTIDMLRRIKNIEDYYQEAADLAEQISNLPLKKPIIKNKPNKFSEIMTGIIKKIQNTEYTIKNEEEAK